MTNMEEELGLYEEYRKPQSEDLTRILSPSRNINGPDIYRSTILIIQIISEAVSAPEAFQAIDQVAA